LSEVCGAIPDAVDTVIGKCLSPDRSKRIQTPQEFIEFLSSDPSLASYHPYGSRQVLGGIAGRIAKVFKNGTLNGHTRRMLQKRFLWLRKFSRFMSELAQDCFEIFLSLLKRLFNRWYPFAQIKTQAGPAPVAQDKRPHFISRMMKGDIPVIKKFSGFLHAFSPRVLLVASGIIVFMIGVLVSMLFFIITRADVSILRKRISEGTLAQSLDASRKLNCRGISWDREELLNRCAVLPDRENIELAAMASKKITELLPDLARGYVLLGRVSLKSGEYDDARNAFLEAKRRDNGEKALDEEQVHILICKDRE